MRRVNRRALASVLAVAAAVLLGGCATHDHHQHGAATEVMPFSVAKADGEWPKGWAPRRISRFKKDTTYQLVSDVDGVTVIRARADAAASGLAKDLNVMPAATPYLRWRWRVPALIATADNRQRDLEDSPARVIVSFDGDDTKLDFEERALSSKVRALTGKALPYATLIYVWENQRPVGEIIDSNLSSRVKMIVVESGPAQAGRWIHYERNIAKDFERAFDEKPGRINSVGIMTDTDNTGESAMAYYGDIRFAANSALNARGNTR